MIYLDNAATTLQKPQSVGRSMAQAVGTLASPGRGGHPYAMRAAETAFRCRERAAQLFGADDPEKVVFTMNATHALNIAIQSLAGPDSRVLVSGYEHNAVTRPLHALGCETVTAEFEPFSDEAALEAFRQKLAEGADVAVVNHVSNVTGYILPMDEIAAMCRGSGVPLIVDASQSAGCAEVSLASWGAAFIAMPGHKGLYGPQGTGLLLCGMDTVPVLYGGTGSDSASLSMPDFLPDRLEAGTHNMPGIAGLSAGIEFVRRTGTGRIRRHEQTLIRLMAEGLRDTGGVTVWCAEDWEKQAGVLSFTIAGLAPESVGERLAQRGIAVRAGLHCSPLAHRTLGTFPEGTVRASVSAFTTENDVRGFLKAVRVIASGRG